MSRGRTLVLAAVILSSGWMLSPSAAQLPFFREVNSDAILAALGGEGSIAATEETLEEVASTLSSIEGQMAPESTHGGNVIATGPGMQLEAKDQDGSAFPNLVTEGQSVRAAASLSGIQYVAVVDETGVALPMGPSTQHYRTSAGATEDEFEVKATAGVLTGGIVTNTAATVSYLKCFNLTAANTTPASSTVWFAAAIPGYTVGAGFTLPIPPGGLTFSTALTCILVKGAADTDVAEVGANEVKVNLFYR
jgi:hypothetical protein